MDVGKITNNSSVAEQTNVSKESRQSEVVKKYGVTGKTIGKPKLSEKAQQYYEQLQAKYQDMDFILVSNDKMDAAKSQAGKFAGSKKMLVLVDEETIERMANDEEYRKQYEGMIEYAQKKMPELQDLLKNIPGAIGGGVQINENGTVSFFAVMDKSYDEQAERLEKQKQEKIEEKKEAEKKAEKEKQKSKTQKQKITPQNKSVAKILIYKNTI